MAELNVQPKKQSSILPWILLLLGIIAVVWFLTRDKDDDTAATATTADTTTTMTTADTSRMTSAAPSSDWSTVDFSAPVVTYDEITDRDISVRGNNSYGIYSINETILFDEGKSELRSAAKTNLTQVKTSIDKRYKGGEIRVYGYTDSTGGAQANKDLAQQRANAVKDWLQSNGVDGSKISVNAVGEGQPAASNSTEKGRKQNRRVEIVARGTGNP